MITREAYAGRGAFSPRLRESTGGVPTDGRVGTIRWRATAGLGMLQAVSTGHDLADAAVTLPVGVRDLSPRDLPACTWSGSATHLRSVERELARAALGEVDYLAVCTPVDLPVAIGGIDYQAREGAGTLWQLAVLPALQGRGLGTLLVRAAEQRVRHRGLRRAELAVEEDNPRARALYERLGYVAYGREPDAWDEEGPEGSVRRHETMCVLMARDL
ncbi:acetyltransferase (GNAT) family protein [Streptomyces sp. DvalAA-21]|nr:GCN5-related N-acetyltransferase [Streptomyces sp. SirexAA-E]PZX37552.1 acetyltransferase (GNAT) family protein [Streptomyces sp. DvalAA-21]RAJ33755.1 acetyltransferase (GNAT) family protein [Streptomyces sp. DpondAA-E10]RAJ48305.1 acetyltransferase (GNAT) family protein [Streptomyces sp. DpondAA-A50]SCD69165.1 Acetyltransferase (GNAT) family protein [Streptomyces sp. DpondAA-F4a]SCM07790.1 Acetyltransferase (GNAT) family protein [Streptomyces sp. DpondAA-F4]